MKVIFKCRMCRMVLLIYPETLFLSVHGELMELNRNQNSSKIEFFVKDSSTYTHSGCSPHIEDVFYINETHIPQWITDCIDKGGWTKGKLQCPGCSRRIGSFDFVSGFHCSCQLSVVPAIHLVRRKLDYFSSSGTSF